MRLTKTINHGKSRWRVSTRLNGKRTQRFFTTRKQARVWMRSVQANASVEDFWKLRSPEEKSEIVELFHEAEAKAVRLKDVSGGSPLDSADESVVDLLREHGGKTGEELKAEGK